MKRFLVEFHFDQTPKMPQGDGQIEVLAETEQDAKRAAKTVIWRQNYRQCGLNHVVIGDIEEIPDTSP